MPVAGVQDTEVTVPPDCTVPAYDSWSVGENPTAMERTRPYGASTPVALANGRVGAPPTLKLMPEVAVAHSQPEFAVQAVSVLAEQAFTTQAAEAPLLTKSQVGSALQRAAHMLFVQSPEAVV